MQLVNDRRGFWKAFWKSDGISGKKPEVDDPTLRVITAFCRERVFCLRTEISLI
jgi:hypothetical protein